MKHQSTLIFHTNSLKNQSIDIFDLKQWFDEEYLFREQFKVLKDITLKSPKIKILEELKERSEY
ncbi:MAG: hypothetical protein JXR60_05310 [Bacteroidales bacterium]|nr:hypothetical protein [Bacteroidales bacterium]